MRIIYVFLLVFCLLWSHSTAESADIYVKSAKLSDDTIMKYQEAGDPDKPVVLVLRNHPGYRTTDRHLLIDMILKKLGDHYYVIAPYWRKSYTTDRIIIQYSQSHDDLVDLLKSLHIDKYSIFADYYALPVLSYFSCTYSVYDTELIMSRNAHLSSYVSNVFAQKYNPHSVFGGTITKKDKKRPGFNKFGEPTEPFDPYKYFYFFTREEGKCKRAVSQVFLKALAVSRELKSDNINDLIYTKGLLKHIYGEKWGDFQDPFSYGEEPKKEKDKLFYGKFTYSQIDSGNKKQEVDDIENIYIPPLKSYDEVYDYGDLIDQMNTRLDQYHAGSKEHLVEDKK